VETTGVGVEMNAQSVLALSASFDSIRFFNEDCALGDTLGRARFGSVTPWFAARG